MDFLSLLKYKKNWKEEIHNQWLYELKVEHQKKNYPFGKSLWFRWATLIPLIPGNNEYYRKDILYYIGINKECFDNWYIKRRQNNPLNECCNFYEVVFEFLYDRHLLVYKKNMKIRISLFLIKLGLHREAVLKCVKEIIYGQTGFFTAISYVYSQMITYAQKY